MKKTEQYTEQVTWWKRYWGTFAFVHFEQWQSECFRWLIENLIKEETDCVMKSYNFCCDVTDFMCEQVWAIKNKLVDR